MIGPPASGKGTQAQTLADKYQIPHISTGNLIREEIQKETPRGMKYFADVQAGKFAPDKVIMEILYERISQKDCRKGFILDGFPRTKNQAKLLDKYSKLLNIKPVIVHISISDEIVTDRIVNRVVCRKCGTPYHLLTSSPKQEGVCDQCGGVVDKRGDDSAEVMKNRLELYHEKTEPLFKYYEKKGHLVTVDGTLAKDQVALEINNATLTV